MPARRTLTWDEGAEMARHDLMAYLFPEGVYFADPGSPWRRRTNENMNGFLRQYFARSVDLHSATIDDLRRVEHLLNERVRRNLDWSTPAVRFARLLAA